MGLYERLLKLEEPRLSVHGFMAALGEKKRGRVSAAQITASFNLSAAEQTEAAALYSRFDDAVNPLTSVEVHEVLLLAQEGRAYVTVAALKNRLGVP